MTGSGPVVVTSVNSYTLLLPGGEPVTFSTSPLTTTATEAGCVEVVRQTGTFLFERPVPQFEGVEGGTGPYTSTQVTQFSQLPGGGCNDEAPPLDNITIINADATSLFHRGVTP